MYRIHRSFENHLAAFGTAAGTQIDKPIRKPNEIQVMLDHDHRIPLITQLEKQIREFLISDQCKPVVGSSRI